MGRPRKFKRAANLWVQMEEEEKEQILTQAHSLRQSASDYVRALILQDLRVVVEDAEKLKAGQLKANAEAEDLKRRAAEKEKEAQELGKQAGVAQTVSARAITLRERLLPDCVDKIAQSIQENKKPEEVAKGNSEWLRTMGISVSAAELMALAIEKTAKPADKKMFG